MNIEKANTEAFRQYHDFHENLNSTIKILSTSITYMKNNANDITFKEALVETEPSWKYSPISSINKLSNSELLATVTTLGIVSAFSAMDDLIISIEAEISRWNKNKLNKEKLFPLKEYESSDEKIINLYNKYNWSNENIKWQFEVLKYFRFTRNCIAHKNSKVSESLSNLSKSQEFKDNFTKFFHQNDKPNLPEFEYDEIIILNPRLVFFCSKILRNIANDLNQKLLIQLKEDGFLNMVAHHVFFQKDIIRTPSHRTPEAVLNNILQNRYRVIMEDNKEIIKLLKNLNLWKKCIIEYHKKYSHNKTE